MRLFFLGAGRAAVCVGLLVGTYSFAQGQAPVRIVLGGHMYGLDGMPSPGFQNAVDLIAAHSPDAMVIGGDLTQNGASTQWDNLFALISDWPFQMLPVIGNHDAENRTEWINRFGDFYSVGDVGSTRVIRLDMVAQPNSYPADEQLAFLMATLVEARDDIAVTDVIIATHKLFWLKNHPRYEKVHAFAHNWHSEFDSKGNDVNPLFEEVWPAITNLAATKPTTVFAGDSGWTYLGPHPCLFYDVLDGVTLLACGTNPSGNANRDAGILYESDGGVITLSALSYWGDSLGPVDSYDVPFWESFFSTPPESMQVAPPGPSGLDEVLLPGGWFEMGDHIDPKTEDYSETTGYRVTVSRFHLATKEVTVDEYVEFLNAQGTNNCGGADCIDLDDPDSPINEVGGTFVQKSPEGIDLPVTEVSWLGALAYCNYKSAMEGLDPAYNGVSWDRAASGWRLPTEAEFEFAMRGGAGYRPGEETYYRFPWGANGVQTVRDHANYYGTGGLDVFDGLAPVGSFPPNAFGLYDVSGNAFEWVFDPWTWEYERPPAAINPSGPGSWPYLDWRVLRGGGHNFHWRACRNGYRSAMSQDQTHSYIGFRVARNAASATSAPDELARARMLRLGPAFPNPFNPATTIAFDLPREGHVRLDVFSLTGRKVATLVDETRRAGSHTFRWRGQDGSGRELASGTYFLRLSFADDTRSQKITLVR